MKKTTKPTTMSLEHLLKHLDELSQMVKTIQSGTVDIVQDNNSQSSMQLEDVLKSTEAATLTIIDSATAIQGIVNGSAVDDKDKGYVEAHVTKIYEACNFQDVTGQRIKKVLKNFELLEARIISLADATKGSIILPAREAEAAMMSGPQLSGDAPSQDDVDKLFKTQ